jgi:hypothetical protein
MMMMRPFLQVSHSCRDNISTRRLRLKKASYYLVTRDKRDDLINPYWIEDKDLRRGEVDYLSGTELTFWKDLIEKYLKPIDADKQKEVSSF